MKNLKIPGMFVAVFILGSVMWIMGNRSLESARNEYMGLREKEEELCRGGCGGSAEKKVVLMEEQSRKAVTELNQAIADFLPPELAEVMSRGKALSGVEWKRMFNTVIGELHEKARSSGVAVREDFYYGFEKYQLATPDSKDVKKLEVELLAVKAFAGVLLKVPVFSVEKIEWGEVEVHDCYEVYPMEVIFESASGALREVMNGLVSSEYFFIPEILEIRNGKGYPKTMKEIQECGGAENRLVTVLAGDERLRTKINVRLVVWRGES